MVSWGCGGLFFGAALLDQDSVDKSQDDRRGARQIRTFVQGYLLVRPLAIDDCLGFQVPNAAEVSIVKPDTGIPDCIQKSHQGYYIPRCTQVSNRFGHAGQIRLNDGGKKKINEHVDLSSNRCGVELMY